MKINPYTRITPATPSKPAEALRRSGPAAEGAPSPSPAGAASVTLSEAARKMADEKAEAEAVMARIAALPALREDRLQEVRQRLSTGYYGSPAFTEELADKLAQKPEASGP